MKRSAETRGAATRGIELLVARLPERELLEPSEVAVALDVAAETVRQMLKQGRLEYVDIGSRTTAPRYKILRYSVVKFLEGGINRRNRK